MNCDTIGNRQSAVVGGSSSTSTYSANLLNQYSQRTVPCYLWEIGTAASNATVTINNQPANRHGEYFSREVAVNNSTAAVFTQLTTVAVLLNGGGNTNQPDVVTTDTGHEFLPQSPEQIGFAGVTH